VFPSLGFTCSAFLICSLVLPYGFAQSTFKTSKERALESDFDDSVEIPCAQLQGELTCIANIARGVHGDASIVVTFSNGFARTLYFEEGGFTRANSTVSGHGTDTDWIEEDGMHFIRVDDQRFEISDAFIIG